MLEWQSEVWTAAHRTPHSLEYAANNSVSIFKIVLTVSYVTTFALHNLDRDDRPGAEVSWKQEFSPFIIMLTEPLSAQKNWICTTPKANLVNIFLEVCARITRYL